MARAELIGISREFERTLPRKLMSAGILARDESGRVLLVKAIYRDSWTLPGGVVEHAESPMDAARREVSEELGVDLAIGRLLVVDYKSAKNRLDSVQWIFDGGTLRSDTTDRFVLERRELADWSWVESAGFRDHVAPWIEPRLHAAVQAARDGQTLYLHDGRPT